MDVVEVELEEESTITVALLHFNGWIMADVVEPGTQGWSAERLEAQGRHVVESYRSKGRRDDDKLVDYFLRMLCRLYTELRDEFGVGRPHPEMGLRPIRKLWRDDFQMKLTVWRDFILALTVLRAHENDDEYGCMVARISETTVRRKLKIFADQVYDTCACCGKQGSFRRCPCSKKFRYCGPECHKMVWGAHKAEHKQRMAAREVKAARKAGADVQ